LAVSAEPRRTHRPAHRPAGCNRAGRLRPVRSVCRSL
jgi:hypothetical protein